jgi:gliding motility-associated-like protein
LDLSTYSFKNILPVNNASIQYQGAVAYDYDKSRFFLFGGFQPTANYTQNQTLPNTKKTFRFRTSIDAGFVEFNGQGDQPPAATGTDLNGVAYYDPVGKRMIWARYDGIWAYYPDSTLVPISQKSFLWSTGDTTASITVSPMQSTQYKITRTSAGNVCVDSILISVQTMQTALQQTVSICGDTTRLDAGAGFNAYKWSTGETTQQITVNKNGNYLVTISKGTCTSKDSSQVQLASAVLDFLVKAQKDSICVGESDTLNVLSPQAGVTYSWYLPGSSIKVNTGTYYGLNNVSKNTSYIINATSNPPACLAKSATAQIVIRNKMAKPIVKIDSLGATAVVFSWNAVPDASSYLISLDNGLSFLNPNDGPLALRQSVQGIVAGQSQKIIVKAMGQSSCQTSDTSQMIATTINPFGNGIFVPNAFTPNADGINDVLLVYGTAISAIKFKIYNQWGELVFNTTDIAIGWDGNSKGNKSPASIYNYTLEATMLDGTTVINKGSITLIR